MTRLTFALFGAALLSASLLRAQELAEGPAATPAEAQPAKPKADELYAPPSADDARSRAVEAVAARGVKDKALLEQVAALWTFGDEEPTARLLLDKSVAAFALIDPQVDAFVRACTLIDAPFAAPQPTFLKGGSNDFFSVNLRLFYGRYLAERRMYDEALEVLANLDPKQTVDPATCLFYRAVAQHQLLMKPETLKTVNLLLKNTEAVPPSYSQVATLMQYELEGLNPKTLGHIARKMSDSERRLDLARPGERVQKVQDEIIADLDELIKKLEQDGGGGGGGGADGQNNSNQSSNPANDSRVKGAKAPGNVDPKKTANKADWGNMEEKDVAKAKNQIGRHFPSHYRDAVEEYFKKLANRPAGAGK